MKRLLYILFILVFFPQERLTANEPTALTDAEEIQLKTLEKEITGPQVFKLDTPLIDRKTKTISVEKYGLSPSNSPEKNLDALGRISDAVRNAQGMIISFPKNKVYTIAVKKGNKLLDLINAKDVIVEGNGSRLKFQDADMLLKGKGFIYLDGCERVIIRNISVGCDWNYKPLALIGKIVQFEPETNEAIYHIISYGKLNGNNQEIWAAQEWDPVAKTRTINGVASNFAEYKILTPEVLKVKFRTKFNSSIVGKHSLISIKQNTQYSGVVLEKNDHILIENVKFLGVPFMAVEGRDRAITNHLVIRNCTLTPPQEDTYFSAGEGFDVRSPWYLFENNYVDYCYDDVMNFDAGIIGAFLAGGMVKNAEETKKNEIIADHLQHYFTKNVIVKGAKFGLADENFKPIGWESTLESFEYQMNYHKGHSAAHRCILRFKDELPDNVPSNYILYSPAVEEGGYIIRNNTINNCIRHAIWAGNGNGLIENNTIYQSGYPSIMLQMTSRWSRWFKGFYPSNVIIRGNKIINSNTTLRQPASLFIGGGYDTQSDGFYPIDFGVTSNVLIENNEIVNAYQAALGAWSCENIIIRNNKIINPFTQPLVSTSRGNGALFVKNSKNVFLLDNEMVYQKSVSKPNNFTNENNENILLLNNTGF